MKKVYEVPMIEDEKVVIEDICTVSVAEDLGDLAGDSPLEFTWGK